MSIQREEIRSLTGLRFVLAFWVLLYHSRDMATGPLEYIVSKGYLGVDFFFVLSGFILAYAYEQSFLNNTPGKGVFGNYLKNRFARVYPVHLFTLLFSIVFLSFLRSWGALTYSMPWSDLPVHALLLHAWGFIDPLHWNDPSWSISAEWFAYISLFPLNTWLVRKYGRKASILTTILGILLLLYISEIVLDRPGFIRHARYGIVRIIPEFLLGMSIYLYKDQLLQSIKNHSWLWWLMTAACLLIIRIWAYDYFILPVIVFTIIGLLPATRLSALLSGKRMVYLGHASYALYMVQLFSLHIGHILTPKIDLLAKGLSFYDSRMFYFPCTISVCMIMAIATHHFIEIPARNWIRTWSFSKRASCSN